MDTASGIPRANARPNRITEKYYNFTTGRRNKKMSFFSFFWAHSNLKCTAEAFAEDLGGGPVAEALARAVVQQRLRLP